MSEVIMKEIAGYEGLYSVTNDGRVYSHRRGRFLKLPCNGPAGYYNVRLCAAPGPQVPWLVHRLVATTFLPTPPYGAVVVNHKNGIKTDNRVENLEWCSYSDNMKHAVTTGLLNNIGEQNPRCKLTAAQVQEIRSLRGIYSQRELAKMYGVQQSNICHIQRRRHWGSV